MGKKLLNFTLVLMLLLSITACNKEEAVIQDETSNTNVEKSAEDLLKEIEEETVKPEQEEKEVGVQDTEDKIQVYFINVGQADSALIVTPNKEAILVDAGEKGDASTIIAQIEETGVKDLDLVVATHPHADHIGGMEEVIENYDAKEIMMSSFVANTKTFEELLDEIKDQNKKVTRATVGLIREIDGVVVEVVGVDSVPSDTNNSSIVLRVTYGKNSILMMGDAEEQAEEVIVQSVPASKLKAEILKVGHHGSDTSSSEHLLDIVEPQAAVISVGADNTYGHPNLSTIEKLNDRRISIYRTDESGTVKFELGTKDIVTVLSDEIMLADNQKFSVARGLMFRNIQDNTIGVAEVSLVEEVFIDKNDKFYHKVVNCPLLEGSTKKLTLIQVEVEKIPPCTICYN